MRNCPQLGDWFMSRAKGMRERIFFSSPYKSDPNLALSCFPTLRGNPRDERSGGNCRLGGTKLSRFAANCLDRDGASSKPYRGQLECATLVDTIELPRIH